MKNHLLLAVCFAILMLGLSFGLYKVHFPPGPVADEATYVMIAQSLWHEQDLTYDHRDLERAYQIWDHGPHGLILMTVDGGETMRYGKPYVYSLAAVPFYALFGVQGFSVFNMCLFLAMAATGWWLLRRSAASEAVPEGQVGLYVGGFFFASVAVSYTFWMQPEVFNMACIFFPLAIWIHLREIERWSRWHYVLLAVAGMLLAAAFISKEPMVILGAPIGVDLLWQRRWRAVPVVAAATLVALVALIGVQLKMTDRWSPYRDAQRRSFENNYPIEMPGDPWELYKGTSFGSWSGVAFDTNPRLLVRNAGYFLFGRHVGLLPYFPFALFAVGLFLAGPKDRLRVTLLLAILAYCALLFFIRPYNFQGGAGFLGNRYFANVYPLLLFLPGRLRLGRWLLVPFTAAALWVMPVIAVPVQQIAPEFGLQMHTRGPTFQPLPTELTLLAGGSIPGYWRRGWAGAVWFAPKHNFFALEKHPNGVWVRGSSSSEVILVSPEPMDTLRCRVQSLSGDNVLTLDSGAHRLTVSFDSEAKRAGTPIELPLGEPIDRDLGPVLPGMSEYYYRLRITTTHGIVPMRRDPNSTDLRYLGVFLDFTGEGA